MSTIASGSYGTASDLLKNSITASWVAPGTVAGSAPSRSSPSHFLPAAGGIIGLITRRRHNF